MSLVGRIRGHKGLITNNYPNNDISDNGDTGPLIEISLLEEGGSGICGSTVDDVARFCMSSMEEFNNESQTR